MIVAVGSMWRNSDGYIDRALRQFEGLAEHFDEVQFGFVENESADNTGALLDEWADGLSLDLQGSIAHVADGCPYYPSADMPERWRHLAWVANHTIDLISDEADIFLYVESDLAWDPADLAQLVEWADETQAAHAACNLMAGDRWYDTWGSRIGDEHFDAGPPYHSKWDDSPFQVDSTCGALALPAKVARATRFQPEDCYVGWCRSIREEGTPIWLQPDIKVHHP